MGKKRSHRSRALWNSGWIILGIVVLYLQLGAPYFTRQQADDYGIRRSLASNMDVILELPVPDDSAHWAPEALEKIYLLRYEDAVGTMLTMERSSGASVFFGPSYYVQPYENRDGMAIFPLYGVEDKELGGCESMTMAVVPMSPEIAKVDVTFYDGERAVAFSAQEQSEGVFVATCTGPMEFFSPTVYDDSTANNYFGAIGYDQQGNVIALAKSLQEEYDETR